MIFKAKADSALDIPRYINAIQRNFPEERKSPSYFLATTGTGKLSDVLKRIRRGGRVMLSYKIPSVSIEDSRAHPEPSHGAL